MQPTPVWKAVLVASTLLAAGARAQLSTPVKPMAADAHPSFAVATIKPHDPNSNRQGFNPTADRYTVRNQTVVSLMMFAYSIDKHQIVNAPSWTGTDHYNMKGATDTPGPLQLRGQDPPPPLPALAPASRLTSFTHQDDGNDLVVSAVFGGPMKTLTYRLEPNGWLSIDYVYALDGAWEYFGVWRAAVQRSHGAARRCQG